MFAGHSQKKDIGKNDIRFSSGNGFYSVLIFWGGIGDSATPKKIQKSFTLW